MSEKYITTSNKILYYLVAPCLLLYFILIDIGVIKCTITGLLIFSITSSLKASLLKTSSKDINAL